MTYRFQYLKSDRCHQLTERKEEGKGGEMGPSKLGDGDFRNVRHDRCPDETGRHARQDLGPEKGFPVLGDDFHNDGLHDPRALIRFQPDRTTSACQSRPTYEQHEERKDVHVGTETEAVRSDGGQHLKQYLHGKVGPSPDGDVDGVELEIASGRIAHSTELIDETCRTVSVLGRSCRVCALWPHLG